MKQKLGLIFFIGLLLLSLFSFFLLPFLFKSPIPQGEMYRIGILLSGPERLDKVRGFIEGMRALGFVEGVDYRVILRDSQNDQEKMKEYADELDGMGLDLIVTGGAIETQTFQGKKEGKTPILFMGVADAVQLKLVERYGRPGGRITGLENGHVDLSGKRLQLLKLLLPSVRRVVVLYDKRVDASLLALKKVHEVAERESIPLFPISISNEQQLNRFQDDTFKNGDALLLLPGYYLEEISPRLAEIALKKGLPLFGLYENDVRNGFLLSYGISYYDQGYQCARMASQLLHGQDPSTLPVETPETVKLLVNPETEQALHLIFSPAGEAFVERIRMDREKGGE